MTFFLLYLAKFSVKMFFLKKLVSRFSAINQEFSANHTIFGCPPLEYFDVKWPFDNSKYGSMPPDSLKCVGP